MGENQRLTEIYKDYSWYLTLKKMCNGPADLERVGNLKFQYILDWMEISKLEEEILYIEEQQSKNKGFDK